MATKKKVVSADTLSKGKKTTTKNNNVDKLKDLVIDNKDLIGNVAESLLGVDINGDGKVNNSKKSTKSSKKTTTNKKSSNTLSSVIDLLGDLSNKK